MNKGGYIVNRKDLLYPDLSFKINGALFNTHNQLGGGHHEKHYQKGVSIVLKDIGLNFTEQYYVPLLVNGKPVGNYFLDFLIEDKIVLELKRGIYLPRNITNQVIQYLTSLDLKLAIIGCFAHDCVIIKRIVNPKYL